MSPDERFDRCIPLVLAHEGGATFTNDPDDPGGPTRWGVTLPMLQSIWPTSTIDDVRDLSEDKAKQIYKAWFWNACGCDKLPEGVDYAVFDCSVNQGVMRAKMFLQRALGITPDGLIGAQTLLAIKGCDPATVILNIQGLRENRYRASSNFPKYGRGWIRRVTEVTTTSMLWAHDAKAAA